MSDSLSLDDETVSAQLAEAHEPIAHESPWHERRSLGIGCSDLPAVFLALDLVRGEVSPKYLLDRARRIRPWDEPRIFLEKANLVRPLRVGAAAKRGTAREVELLRHWIHLLKRRQYACDEERMLIPDTIRHASEVPHEWLPLVDRHSKLVDTPDAWGRDRIGNLVAIQVKCSAAEKPFLPWHWRCQLQGECIVQGASWGLLVCGERWASDWKAVGDGPVRAWPVEVEEADAKVIRQTVGEAWNRIETLKKGKQAA